MNVRLEGKEKDSMRLGERWDYERREERKYKYLSGSCGGWTRVCLDGHAVHKYKYVLIITGKSNQVFDSQLVKTVS
jgi:hypothetical protein